MQKFLRTLMLMAVMLLPFASQAQTLPFSEGFGTSIPTGWSMYTGLASNVFNGTALNSATSVWNFGTNNGLTDNHARVNIYGTSCNKWLVTPSIALTGISSAQLSFDLAFTAYSGSSAASTSNIADDKFMVIISTDDGATWSEANAIKWMITDSVTAGAATYDLTALPYSAYQTFYIDLTSYIGSTIKIAFYGESTASGGDNNLHLDNVYVGEPITCFAVSGVAIDETQTTTNSLTLSWTDANNTGATYVVYDMSDTTVVASGITGTTYTVTGLDANTLYTFAVMSDCGAGDVSLLSSPVSARTACAAMALPWTCGFEADEIVSTAMATALPYCSARYIDSTVSNRSYPYSYSSTTYSHGGSRCLYYYGTTGTTYPAVMAFVLPQVDVTTYPMNANRLTFWARMSSTSNSKYVYVATTTDPTFSNGFSGLTMVDSILISGTTQTLYSVPLTNATATDPYLVLMVNRGTGNLYMDDMTLEEMPSCLEVTGLTTDGITSNSVVLSWSDASNASATYTVYNMADSTILASGLAGTTYTVTGLNANTDYTFGVQAICAAGDATITTLAIHTDCAVENLPFVENFSATLASDPCWRGNNGTAAADVFNGTALVQGVNSAWTYSSTVSNGLEIGHYRVNIYATACKRWMITPAIDLSSAVAPQLSFDVAFTAYSGTSVASGFESNTSQAFMVIVSTDGGNTWLEANATKWQQEGGNYTLASIASTSYINQIIDLTPYVGDTVKIAFYCQSTVSGGDNNLHLDNISIDEAPACPAVTGLAASNITTDGATLTWTGDAASYNVYDMSDTTLVGTATTTSYDLTGLTANTAYVFGVAADCGSSESTIMTVSFGTACDAVALPFTEGFEATSTTLACWSTDGPGSWTFATGDYSATTGAFEGSVNAKITHSSTGNATKLISPVLDLGTADGVSLTFAHIQRSWSGDQDELRVYYRTSATDAWTLAAAYTDEVSTWTVENLILSGAIYQVAFEMTDGYGYGVAVDSVVFDMPPACIPVTNLAASNITSTDATLTWTGDAASYNVYNMSDTTLVGTATTTSYDLTGLTASTAYVFGVAAACGSSESTIVTVSFNTACDAVTLPYIENFTATSATRNCWDLVSNNTSNVGGSNGMGFLTVADHEVLQFSSYSNASDYNQYGYSPLLNVSADATALQVSVVYGTRTSDYLYFGYIDGNDTVWDPTAYNTAGTSSNPNWQTYTAVIPATTTRLAVHYYGNYAYYAWIDSVNVTELTASYCYPVTALTVDSATATSIFLSWTDNDNDGATYSIYSADGTVIATGVTTTSYEVTGLTAMTGYTFGVVANCSADNASDVVTVSAATACAGATCTIEINGTDSYGDGWNGAALNVMQAGAVVGTFTLASGSSNSAQFTVCSSAPVTFSWVSGNYDDEASFEIKDGGGMVVYTCTNGSTLTAGSVFYTMTDACPSCIAPVVTLDTVTTTTATISWTSTATSFDVYNGETAVATGISAMTYTFTGLTAGTAYTFGVVANCSATDVSSMATVAAVTEFDCQDVTTLPYNYGFEGGLGCWTSVNGSTTGVDWLVTDCANLTGVLPHSGSYAVSSWSWNGSAMNANAWLISPKFVLPTVAAGDSLVLSWWEITNSAYADSYSVVLSTTTNDTAAFTTVVRPYGVAAGSWTLQTVDLTSYAGQSVYVAFHHVDYDMNYLLIDDISVTVGAAPAPVPDTLTVTFAVNDATMGTTVPAPGTYQYLSGDTVSFEATPNAGYHFAYWVLNYGTGFDTVTYQTAYGTTELFLTYYSNNVTLTAYFEAGNPDSVAVTYAVNDATMGSINPSGMQYAYVGSMVQAEAIANSGYTMQGWVLGVYSATGATLQEDTLFAYELDFDNPYNFGTIPQSFADNGYTISVTALFGVGEIVSDDSLVVVTAVNDATMGTIIPAPGTHVFHAGDTFSVMAVPAAGYHVESWHIAYLYDGIPYVDTTISLGINEIFPLDTADYYLGMTMSFTANFAAGAAVDYMTVTTIVNDTTMGSLTPQGTNVYHVGDTVQMGITVNPGYYLYSLHINVTHPLMGSMDTTLSGEDIMVDIADLGLFDTAMVVDEFLLGASITVSAIFAAEGTVPNVYTVSVGYDMSRGTVTGQGEYVEGSTVTLTAVAFNGYEFYAWVENDDTVGRQTVYTINNIDADHNLTAVFVVKTSIDDVEADNVNIYSTDNMIVVRGAEGKQVVLFDVNGRMLSREANAAEQVEFRVNNSGVYLVKVANAAAKRVVVIR